MSILEIVFGVVAALVLLGIFGSIVGKRLKEVAKEYPKTGGDGE